MERTPVSFGPGVFFIFWGIFMDKVFKTYDEQIALYNFDARIRRIFFKYILLIETIIKNLIAYTFSQAHPQENYLVYTNFNRNLGVNDTIKMYI